MRAKIPRAKLDAIVKMYDAGQLGKINYGPRPTPLGCYVKNTSQAAIRAGDSLKISGFTATMNVAQARSRVLSGEIVLAAQTAGVGDDRSGIGFAAEAIKPGKVGRATFQDLQFALVTLRNAQATTDAYCNAALVTSENQSVYRILAGSSVNGNLQKICALCSVAVSGTGVQRADFSEVSVIKTVSLAGCSVSLLSSSTASEGSIPYVAAVECVDGEIVVTTNYLTISATLAATTTSQNVLEWA